MTDRRMQRLDANRVRLENPQQIHAVLFAREDVPVESAAVDELVELLEIEDTALRVADAVPDAFSEPPSVHRVALTPDFHKARGVPVGTTLATRGFTVPQAIGNDINCGMRVHPTTLRVEQIRSRLDELETAFRHIFFEGGRDIPMSRAQRQALFTEGLTGLLSATPTTQTEGLWSLFHDADLESALERVEHRGSLPASDAVGLDDFLGPADRLSRDNQIGSIGGGNHFVELQYVHRVLDGPTAHAWGLREGEVTVMIHTGSVAVGHLSGSVCRSLLRRIFPKTLKHPANGIFLLPEGERYRKDTDLFWDVLHNAANFAFANRFFLSLMAWAGLQRVFGDVAMDLLYDAPHNMLWRERIDGHDMMLHRKGSCPARGFEAMQGTPFAFTDEPVLVPGSMGASSFILAGRGLPEALSSASHGAGRRLARGAAGRGHNEAFHRFLEEFRVVTPVDLRRADIRARRDIVERKLSDLKQEAPYAYKGIGPVVETLESSGIAAPVVELRPLMTVKG